MGRTAFNSDEEYSVNEALIQQSAQYEDVYYPVWMQIIDAPKDGTIFDSYAYGWDYSRPCFVDQNDNCICPISNRQIEPTHFKLQVLPHLTKQEERNHDELPF